MVSRTPRAEVSGLLSHQGEKSINFYFITVPLKEKSTNFYFIMVPLKEKKYKLLCHNGSFKSIKVWYSKAQL